LEAPLSNRLMMDTILHNPVFVLFMVLAPGLLLSRLRIGKVSPGSSGIFLVGIVAGLLGFHISDFIITLGLAIFMFILGLQSGPGFFNALGKKSIPYLIIVAVIYGTGMVAMVLCGMLFRLGPEEILGTYAGLFTSSSSLAILLENQKQGPLLSSYGVAYPIGFLATLLSMELIPRLLRKNLYRQMKKITSQEETAKKNLTSKKFIVEQPDIVGKTIDVVNIREKTGATIALIKRGGKVIVVGGETVLEQGDIAQAVGDDESLEKLHRLVGSESFDSLEIDPRVQGRYIVITNRAVLDDSLNVLDLEKNYAIVITRIYRNGMELSSTSEFELALGDSILAVGNKARLERLTRFLGKQENAAPDVDFFLMSLGIAAGMLLGSAHFILPKLGTLMLGSAGGTLVAGMALSYLRRLGLFADHLSTSGKATLKELGLTIFIAGIGVKTGAAFIHTDPSIYGAVILSSLMVITICIAIAFLVIYKLLRFTIVASLACIAGGLTSTPSLALLTDKVKSDYPLLFFSSLYPIAMLGVIASSQVLALITQWLIR
jgi:putative transport protein